MEGRVGVERELTANGYGVSFMGDEKFKFRLL